MTAASSRSSVPQVPARVQPSDDGHAFFTMPLYRHPSTRMAPHTQPATIPGLVRAFRQWARSRDDVVEPDVPGASPTERRMLGGLGGIAASLIGSDEPVMPEAVRAWTASAPLPPPHLLEGVREWLGRGRDPLGDLYSACVSAPNRRRLGTVFTPDAVVNHMLSLAERQLGRPPACVIDPGARGRRIHARRSTTLANRHRDRCRHQRRTTWATRRASGL